MKLLFKKTIGIRNKAISLKSRKIPNIHMLSLTEFWRSVTARILFGKEYLAYNSLRGISTSFVWRYSISTRNKGRVNVVTLGAINFT